MTRVSIAIVAFFGTALVLYWQVQSKQSADVGGNNLNRPDYTVQGLKAVQYNDKGLVNSRISATKMEHYSADNMTYFTQPVYFVYPDEGNTQWRISSVKGNLDKKSGKVTLENNVVIDAIRPDKPIETIETSYLELDLNTMIVTSERAVRVTGQDFLITGQGLYADLNAQKVQLLSQVRGIYETK